ncbi:MAG: S9 family peptidase [Xanthomonadales bacterium]|nr:S9 family peptidase [Xanthomonadales bacterium]
MKALRDSLLPLAAACLLAACSQPAEPPAAASSPAAAAPKAAPVRYDIEAFMDTVQLSGAAFSPDGQSLVYSSNASGIYNVYRIDTAGGEPVALTDSKTDALRLVSHFPADGRLLYSADQGGNELNHLYVLGDDGQVTDLTPGEQLKASFAGWARDEQAFYVATNERDPKYFDLYRYSVEDLSRELIYQNDSGMNVQAISWDGRQLALGKTHTTRNSDVHLLDLDSGETRLLTAHDGDEANAAADFTPDGDLILQTDRDSEFVQLIRLDLETGERQPLFQADWDVSYAGYSRGGQYFLAAINADARTELRLFRAADFSPVSLPALPEGDLNQMVFSADDRRLAMYIGDSRTPSDLFVLDLPDGQPRRLVRSLNPAIDREQLVDGKVVRFKAAGDVEVPGLLYLPREASAENPVPALVWVHGGPGGQSRLNYSPLLQYLVNHGYAVYAINNRGSSGYGKTFFGLDDRQHGEADLADVVASKQFLITIGDRTVGIIGGSYGGYMVLAALAFEPDVFAVGVDIFGVSNWLRTLTSIPPWWESFRLALYAEMGDPATDEARLRRISPLFHADQIRHPLMVLQGANDPRVLQVESDEIVAAVKANNVPVEYLVFPDEGHGFVNRANQIEGYRAVREFLDTQLRGKAAE